MERIELLQKYWEGRQNQVSRYWMYFRLANSVLNEFRSYGYIIVGIWGTTPYLREHWMLAGGVLLGIITIGVPAMVLFGHWLLYRANPAQEYASKTKGSPYQYKVEDATIETAEYLKEIKSLLNENLKHRGSK